MFLMDVNVFVYAHREEAANHAVYRQWLELVIQRIQVWLGGWAGTSGQERMLLRRELLTIM